MIMRHLLATAGFVVLSLTASADFLVTGNPAADNFPLKGPALGIGNYVRSGGGGVFSYNIHAHEFQLDSNNPLTRMVNPWTPGDRILMLGGVFTPGTTAGTLGWGTAIANSVPNANIRFIAKFGTDMTGPLTVGNNFSASTNAPNGGNGLGSHSAGNGGRGSVQVSIGGGLVIPANYGSLLMPSSLTGSNIAQFSGTVGFPSGNGLDLNTGTDFPLSRFVYNVDASNNLTWEVFLNATMVEQFTGHFNPVPTGGLNWVLAVQNGGGGNASSDGLIRSDVYSTPVPPTLAMAGLGGLGLAMLRRFRR